jgi:hypothetical protein
MCRAVVGPSGRGAPGSLGRCPGWPEARAGHAPRPGGRDSSRRRQRVTSVGREGVEDLRKFDHSRCGDTGKDVTYDMPQRRELMRGRKKRRSGSEGQQGSCAREGLDLAIPRFN